VMLQGLSVAYVCAMMTWGQVVSEELWWRWTMQWRCRFMRNNVVAPLMKGSKDLGACGLCSTDCALFLRSGIKGRFVALVA